MGSMIRCLDIKQYRKLKDIKICFKDGVNVISGTNGTCKTSLLHLISNSFQAVHKKCNWIQDPNCVDAINRMNNMVNPKIETLTRGDKTYKDPAIGFKGSLYYAIYDSFPTLGFRRHNFKVGSRYSVKPFYKKGTLDKLPFCPVIYLGLTRLFPFGQFMDDSSVSNGKNYLPVDYQNEIAAIYRRLTGMEVSKTIPQKMGDIKNRSQFETQIDGVDSNTISDGEDNLYIILTALLSLKYYTENVDDIKCKKAILLIDEFDATLHPSQQVNLLKIIDDYALKYNLQVILTTHSITTIESALNRKFNVIYLIDNETNVIPMENPDIYKIQMYLKGKTQNEIFLNKNIPIFSEDNEAREFLTILFGYLREMQPEFGNIMSYFHLVDCKIGSSGLRSIFKDDDLIKTTLGAICILDGDQSSDISHNIITLPGHASPEEVVFDYAMSLYEDNSDFWIQDEVLDRNYGKLYFRDNIKPEIEKNEKNLESKKFSGTSVHGMKRNLDKTLFNKYKPFWKLVFSYWVKQKNNRSQVISFYKDLYSMFRKTAQLCGINPNLWRFPESFK